MQYTRNDMELRRATYRVRGEIIDIFPAESEQEALRVELFDDEVERLSLFDPLTGEIISRIARYTVYPKKSLCDTARAFVIRCRSYQSGTQGTAGLPVFCQ